MYVRRCQLHHYCCSYTMSQREVVHKTDTYSVRGGSSSMVTAVRACRQYHKSHTYDMYTYALWENVALAQL